MIMADANQVLYTNLLHLGFNPVAMEAKHQTKFEIDMFLKPNKKAFEVVSYFLFQKLDSALCKERFRSCWPIFDRKQEQDFRKICYNWIKDISIEYSEARFPRIFPSMLLSPGGDKFIGLYLSFSRYVLQKVIARDLDVRYLFCASMPSLSEDYANVAKTILRILTNKAIQNFLRIQKVSQELHKMWYNYSRNMVSVNRLLKKRINAKKEILKQKMMTRSNSSEEHFCKHNEVASEQNHPASQQQRMDKVCMMWKNIEEFQTKEKKYWEILSSVVSSNGHCVILEGNSMDLHVPDAFLQQCKDSLLQKGLTKFYREGKLDIVCVLKMWNICLEFQHNTLVKAKLPDAESWLESLRSYVEDHNVNVSVLQNLSSKLNAKLLPSIKISVCGLSTIFDTQYKDTEIIIQDRKFELCSGVPRHNRSTSEFPRRKEYVRSPLLNNPFGSIKRKNPDGKEVRLTEVVHLENLGKKQRTKVIWLPNDFALPEQSVLKFCHYEGNCECFQKADPNESECNRIDNITNSPSCGDKCAINDTATSLTCAATSSDNLKDKVTAANENVKEKFVEMIADSVISGTSQDDLNSSMFESQNNLTPDLYEQSAFVTRDRLARTPPQINEKETLLEITPSQNDLSQLYLEGSQINSSNLLEMSVAEIDMFFETISPSGKGGTNNPVTSSSILQNSVYHVEDEMLMKFTSPLAPSSSMNQQNSVNTPGDSSTKTSINTECNMLYSESAKENYFPTLLKEYFDIIDEGTIEHHSETLLNSSDNENLLLDLF